MTTEVRLRDGTRAILWPLGSDRPELRARDRQLLRAHYEQLSADSKYHRFLGAMPHLTDTMLHRLVDEVDGVDHVALVLFVVGPENVSEPVGIARMIRYPDRPAAADVAVTVLDAWQGRGVATALLDALMQRRPPGVTQIVTEVGEDNAPSRAMLRRLGETTESRASGGVIEVSVELPEPEGQGGR
jgi:RimJ/RimL family protein N-acetyltransferase